MYRRVKLNEFTYNQFNMKCRPSFMTYNAHSVKTGSSPSRHSNWVWFSSWRKMSFIIYSSSCHFQPIWLYFPCKTQLNIIYRALFYTDKHAHIHTHRQWSTQNKIFWKNWYMNYGTTHLLALVFLSTVEVNGSQNQEVSRDKCTETMSLSHSLKCV